MTALDLTAILYDQMAQRPKETLQLHALKNLLQVAIQGLADHDVPLPEWRLWFKVMTTN